MSIIEIIIVNDIISKSPYFYKNNTKSTNVTDFYIQSLVDVWLLLTWFVSDEVSVWVSQSVKQSANE